LRGGEAHLRGARSGPNPELTLQHGVGNNTGGLDEDVVVTQLFELGGKRRFRTLEAAGERQRAAAELDAARLELAYQVQLAYLAAQEGEALRDQAAQAVQLAEQFRNAVKTQFEAGEVPRTQVIRSEIEVAAREQVQDEAAAELETRLTALKSLVGIPFTTSVTVPATLATPPVEPALETWRTLASARPEVQVARAEIAARQAAVRGARATRVPDLFVTGTHASLEQWPGNSVRAGFTFPFLDRGVLRAQRQEAEAAASASEAELQERLRTGEQELQTAYDQLLRATGRLQRYRAGQLERVKELAELAQTGYEAGLTSYLEVLDAQRAQYEAQAGYLHAVAEAARARLALERAAGSPQLLATGEPSK
jgi:cobalt-zinc-cadmium efflux system outer membrane protein